MDSTRRSIFALAGGAIGLSATSAASAASVPYGFVETAARSGANISVDAGEWPLGLLTSLVKIVTENHASLTIRNANALPLSTVSSLGQHGITFEF